MSDSAPTRAPRSHIWRALSNRNYLLYFAGQGVSLVGTWLQQTTMTWLVYRLTGSSWMLGVVGFAGQVPAFLMAPIAGVFSDRFPRRQALIATQILAMTQAAIIAWLAFTGRIAVWHLVALTAFLGAVNAYDITLRQAFVTELVTDPADLGNAIALNSTLVNGARLLGPSIAGLIIPLVGEAWGFALNAVSYAAVIAALCAMDIKPRERVSSGKRLGADIAEGFRYAFGSQPVRAILCLLAIMSFAGMPYLVLLPVFARDILKGGAGMLGILSASSGFGALGAGLHLASRSSGHGLGRFAMLGAVGFGASLVVFASSSAIPLSMAALALGGYSMMGTATACNTILQTLVEDRMRGRVMSLYLMAFMGLAPIGSLVAGALADRIGARTTLQIGGAFVIVAGAFFGSRLERLREHARPVYQSKENLPE